MVRGNWQKRVEVAQSRRHETKQNKIRKDRRVLHKSLVQEHLWPLLNQYSVDILEQKKGVDNIFHLWVDLRPLSMDLPDSDIEPSRNRDKRSNLDKKNSFRSYSNHSNSSKKKHPRSHTHCSSGSINRADFDENVALCQQHFFNGRCKFLSEGKGSKRSSCPYNHFIKQNGQLTLADVLHSTGKDHNKIVDSDIARIVLNSSSIAAAAAFAKEDDNSEEFDVDDNSIPKVYYLPINLTSSIEKIGSDSNKSKMKITDFLQKALILEKCPSASIVYTVFNGILIFDRYRGGVLLSNEQESEIFTKYNSSNIADTSDDQGEQVIGCSSISLLPGAVLENILAFLPDEASGVLPMVCKYFSREIGISSPSLWRYLISRRSWPIPEHIHPSQLPRNIYRDSFLSHYKVYCNVRSIEKCAKECQIRSDCGQVAFSTYSQLPICARPWNDISVIAAEELSCSLKVFEAAKSGGKLLCKEIASARIAPFPNSKKFCCTLISMNLDDVYIVCYFKTGKKGETSFNNWLVAVKRNDFLCCVSGANQENLDGLQKYDIQEYYLTHVRENMSDNIYVPQYLSEYITNEGDLDSIKVSLFGNIEACGNGIFMLMGKIQVPNEQHDENWEDLENVILMLFSIPQESIIWSRFIMLDTDTSIDINHDNIVHSCVQTRTPGVAASTFLCCASVPIYLTKVETRSCKTTCGAVDERIITSRKQALFPSSWEMFDLVKRLSLVTKSQLIFADVLQLRYSSNVKVVLSFLSLRSDVQDSDSLYKGPISDIIVEGCHDIRSLHYDGNDHIIMQCLYKGNVNVDEGSTDDNYTNLVVVHIPSQTMILRCCLAAWNGDDMRQSFIYDGTKSESMALFIHLEGIGMTGNLIRSLAKAIENSPKPMCQSKKKKKKRLASKVGKKDGFARGILHGG